MSPTVSEIHQEKIDQLLEIIRLEDITGRGGKLDGEEFLLWAGQKYLQCVSDPPSLEDLQDCVTDGADDQGLDLFHIDEEDEENKNIHLIQAKFRSRSNTIERKEIDSLLDLPNKLMDGASLRTISNERIKEFAKQFRHKVDEGFEIRVVYLTTERPTPQIKSRIDRWNSDKLPLGQYDHVHHRVEIVDVESFLSTSHVFSTNTKLKLERYYDSPGTSGVLSYLVGTIAASELVRVFEKHRFAMFRLNPRGPLGATKVNKDIKHTLENDLERTRFHFLNNGLTAVCESFSINSDTNQVNIRELQIVNGCQTTWNIYDHHRGDGSLEGAFVNIKLIEAPPADKLAVDISQASNSQSQMKDWDFLFNEEKQKRLQEQFERLDAPLFYELKRGEQRFIQQSRLRKTTIKDVAQATWAFIGYPGEAKDRLREIPRLYRTQGSAYNKVFFDGITARHLSFPLDIHNRVKTEWKRRTDTASSGRQIDDRRLYIVWLIGKLVIRAAEIERYRDIDNDVLRTISSHMDEWFDDAYDLANDAIDDTIELNDSKHESGRASLRQLFRSSEYYNDFLTNLERVSRRSFDELKAQMLGTP